MDKEALLVVVTVDKPKGYAFCTVGMDFAGVRVEDIHTVDLHIDLAAFVREDVDVGLAEDNEKLALAVVSEVGVHASFGHINVAKNDDTWPRIMNTKVQVQFVSYLQALLLAYHHTVLGG